MRCFEKVRWLFACLTVSLLASCETAQQPVVPTLDGPGTTGDLSVITIDDGLLASGDVVDRSQASPPLARAVGSASATAGVSVLLLHSDLGGKGNSFKDELVSTGLYSASDIDVNGQMRTNNVPPSLASLSAYDCVMVWSNFRPRRPADYGNRLKEYVQSGGGVVLLAFALSRPNNLWEMKGGIMDDGFNPLDLTQNNPNTAPRSLDFGSALSMHPILSGVSNFTFGSNFNLTRATLDAGALLVGKDDWGDPIIAVNDAGNVAGINVFPSFSKTDGVRRALANACVVVGGSPAPPPDETPPIITANVVGTQGYADWYVSDVDISWAVTDDESDFTTSGCDSRTVDFDTAEVTFTCSATSEGGVSSESVTIKRDATPPTVTYSDNAGIYDVLDEVAITCSAIDVTAGIGDDTCSDIVGPAWIFGLGSSSFSATAIDDAGNEGMGSTSFEVRASFGGLCSLVRDFVSHAGVANSMCAKIRAAERAQARGQTKARDGSLSAFVNEAEAQTGKRLDVDGAAVLILIATALTS